MVLILMNILGYLLLLLFEIISLKQIRGLKLLVWVLANILLVSSVILMAVSPEKYFLPLWAVCTGWALLPVAVLVKVYPLLISLPFRKTYVTAGTQNKLITTGFYALVRYPWIYSMLLILISLNLISASWLLLMASPLIITVNLVLALIQEKFLYDRMFPDYETYRQETPMLWPSLRSLKAFWKTLGPEIAVLTWRRSR